MPQKYLGNMSCCNIMSWECQNVKVEEERERLSQRNVSTARAASCQYLLQTTHYSLPLLNRPISGNWKYAMEKSKINATNVKHCQYLLQTTHYSLPLSNRPISGNWKYTVEKSKTNATNVIMHPRSQTIWGYIWNCTVEKSRTNATCVIFHLLRREVWQYI